MTLTFFFSVTFKTRENDAWLHELWSRMNATTTTTTDLEDRQPWQRWLLTALVWRELSTSTAAVSRGPQLGGVD